MKQFQNVDCKYGAPFGRREVRDDFTKKVRCFRVKLIDGDYDQGGAYFGGFPSLPLYCATNQKGMVTDGNGLLMFTRANSRKEAKINFERIANDEEAKTITWIN